MTDSASPAARTKIVATVGPASRHRLRELVDAGVDVFRLNMAHGDLDGHAEAIRDIRAVAANCGRHVAILVDLAGPKIRLGRLAEDPLEIRRGDRVRLVVGQARGRDELPCTYEGLLDDVSVGDRLLFADGTATFVVREREEGAAVLEAEQDATLRSRQGIAAPGVHLGVPTITPADREHIAWAVEQDVEYLSLSFVRSADDMRELQALVEEQGGECHLVAKIEKREALSDLEDIVRSSHAVMVARGDLGIEVDVAETPMAQKRIISIARRLGRPAIVATEMLDSMRHSPRPTRAEVSDVANAVLDGADACMLSGETAIGDYPVETVRTMNRVMRHAERMLGEFIAPVRDRYSGWDVHPVTAGVLEGSGLIARDVSAQAIVIITRSGSTARWMSRQRPPIPIVAVSPFPETARRMALYWGVAPERCEPSDERDLRQFAVDLARRRGLAEKGDYVVVIAGTGVLDDAHNAVFVHRVE